MKQKPLHEIETEAMVSAVNSTLLIRPDLNTPEMQAVLAHVAREGARNMTELLLETGYISPRTTGALPPPQPMPKADPMLAMLGMLGQNTLANNKKLRAEDLAAPAINFALDVLTSMFSKPSGPKNS